VLITAGGATFAAFPEWYATVFSGFYVPLALLLLGLILRAVCLEYRHKVESAHERAWLDRGLVLGSALPAVLLGIAFANWVRGVPMDANYDMTGSLLSLLSPYALLGGATTTLLFTFHGSVFVALRTTDELRARALRLAGRLGPAFVVTAAVWLGWSPSACGAARSLRSSPPWPPWPPSPPCWPCGPRARGWPSSARRSHPRCCPRSCSPACCRSSCRGAARLA